MRYTRAIFFTILVSLLFSCSSDDGESNPTGNNNPATYSISGKITDQDDLAVSGYTVTLTGSKSATTTTNTNGEYSFADLEANASYTVTVDNISFSVESLSSNETFNFQVVVAKSVLISGTVTDLENDPVAGVPLTFVDTELSSGTEMSTSSDASGHYEFNAEILPGRIWVIKTKSEEHRYAGYSDDPDVGGLDGRGADEAAGTYRTTDVVVDFKQIDDLFTYWSAEGDGVSADARNSGYVSSNLSFYETGTSFLWSLKDSGGQTYWYGLNSAFTVTKSENGEIHYVTMETGYEGIYQITKSGSTWTLKLEVVDTVNSDDTPPTVAGGFGGTNNGADGDTYIWTFTYTR